MELRVQSSAQQVNPTPHGEAVLLQQGEHLFLIARAPCPGIEAKQSHGAAREPRGSSLCRPVETTRCMTVRWA
jgi:hypothetical protein